MCGAPRCPSRAGRARGGAVSRVGCARGGCGGPVSPQHAVPANRPLRQPRVHRDTPIPSPRGRGIPLPRGRRVPDPPPPPPQAQPAAARPPCRWDTPRPAGRRGPRTFAASTTSERSWAREWQVAPGTGRAAPAAGWLPSPWHLLADGAAWNSASSNIGPGRGPRGAARTGIGRGHRDERGMGARGAWGRAGGRGTARAVLAAAVPVGPGGAAWWGPVLLRRRKALRADYRVNYSRA